MAPRFFGCDGCQNALPATEPRIQCLECDDYDLCSNCAVSERFGGDHLPSHRTRVFKIGGGASQTPVDSTVMLVYGGAQPKLPSRNISPLTAGSLLPQISCYAPLPIPPPEAPPQETYTTHTPSAVGVSMVNAPLRDGAHTGSLAPREGYAPPPQTQSPVVQETHAAYTVPSAGISSTSTSHPQPQSAMVQERHPVYNLPSVVSSTNMSSQGGTPSQAQLPAYIPPAAYTPPPSISARPVSISSVGSVGPTSPHESTTAPQIQIRGEYTPPSTISPQTQGIVPMAGSFTPTTQREAAQCWGQFFYEDMSITSVFSQLLDAIFTYLDTRRTGFLTPETYSGFLVNQGYVGQQNTWASNLISRLGKSKEDSADAALRRTYDLFNIEYILRPRPARERPSLPLPNSGLAGQLKSASASLARRALAPSPTPCGTMPVLTRRGFADITAIEVLCDPQRHHAGFVRVLRMYDLQMVRGWGELPRGVLPPEGDARMLTRVHGLAREQGQREVEAKKQRSEERTNTAVNLINGVVMMDALTST
ncbi:hypothetical protein C8R43DRAFT_1148099 [Mycena crocata]|nr:hypothetical protein C8R43DRAFT_1148099 [Mycena crocata]